MKKAQTVSTDVIIAVALFIIVVIFFFSISLNASEERKVRDLQVESTKLANAVSGTKNASNAFVVGSKVSEGKVTELANLTYQNLKDSIGLKSDFCIYFEDEDGNIINISGGKTGLGHSNVSVAGTKCG